MRTVTGKRAVAAAIVTPLLMLGPTACSSDKKPTASDVTPTETASPSVTSSPTEGSTDKPSGVEVSAADAAHVLQDMQAAMKAAKTTKVSMNLGTGSADGVMSFGDETKMRLTMDLGQAGLSGVEMLYVGGEIYMSMPGIAQKGKYFKFGSGSALGKTFDSMKDLTPAATAELMSKSIKKMVKVGEEEIDGQGTVHYRVTIDTKKSTEALGRLGGSTGAPVPNLPPTADYDMWVTDNHLIRRVVVAIANAGVELDYTDWGKPVDIKVPAAKDVMKAPAGL
jgi:hypothetical protein